MRDSTAQQALTPALHAIELRTPDAVKVSAQNADYQIEYTIKIFSLETHGVAEGYACVLHGALAKLSARL